MSEEQRAHDAEFWGESRIVDGRPDFGNPRFGVTKAKRTPKYIYAPKQGALIHKVLYIDLHWFDVGGHGEYLIRRDSPRMTAHTACGQTLFLTKGRSVTCAIPDPKAVLCGRCHGEGPIFGKHSKHIITRKEANARLGCIALSQ